MTPAERIAELRVALEAATKAPWRSMEGGVTTEPDFLYHHIGDFCYRDGDRIKDPVFTQQAARNARVTALLRNHAVALLDIAEAALTAPNYRALKRALDRLAGGEEKIDAD